jgi:hypothetical protein
MPLLYKRHTIVAGASKSTRGANFIPVAYISWEITETQRGTHAMISSARFGTFDEATNAAFAEATVWVDSHAEKLD